MAQLKLERIIMSTIANTPSSKRKMTSRYKLLSMTTKSGNQIWTSTLSSTTLKLWPNFQEKTQKPKSQFWMKISQEPLDSKQLKSE